MILQDTQQGGGQEGATSVAGRYLSFLIHNWFGGAGNLISDSG